MVRQHTHHGPAVPVRTSAGNRVDFIWNSALPFPRLCSKWILQSCMCIALVHPLTIHMNMCSTIMMIRSCEFCFCRVYIHVHCTYVYYSFRLGPTRRIMIAATRRCAGHRPTATATYLTTCYKDSSWRSSWIHQISTARMHRKDAKENVFFFWSYELIQSG